MGKATSNEYGIEEELLFPIKINKYPTCNPDTNLAKSGENTLTRHISSPLLQDEQELVSEFDTDCWEIIKTRKKETDDIPVQISLFIYQAIVP